MHEIPANEMLTAQEHAFELARWYFDLAKLCVNAAEHVVQLTEDSTQVELDNALSLGDQLRVRMTTVQSAERVFRKEFPRLYIDHNVQRILSLDSGSDTKAATAAAGQ